MRLIAHRGFAGEHPENTLAAFRRVGGADAVEFDVRACESGDPVVIHDETVDRVSDGSGPVADHTLAALRDLDVLETGEGVPTLAEALEAIPEGVGVNAELKEWVPAAVDALASADGVLVSAFDPAVLARARDRASGLDRALLVREAGGAIDRAVDLGCVAIHPEVAVVREDPAFVDRAHDAGLRVNAWTARDPETARDLRGAGVDGLIADYPDLL